MESGLFQPQELTGVTETVQTRPSESTDLPSRQGKN